MRHLIFFVSDFHYGRRTAKWNSRLAANSIARITRRLVEIASHYKITKAGICFLGDILDGESVYPHQASEQDLVGLEQAFEGCTLFWDNMIYPLSEVVATLVIDGVPGNHAYIRNVSPKTNLDSLLYKLIAEKAKTARNMILARFYRKELDTLEVKVTEMFDFQVLIGHGHFLPCKQGLPQNAAQLRVLQWLQRWRRKYSRIAIAAFGHFHRWSSFRIGSTLVIFNGTMLRHDEWSIVRYGCDGDRIWTAVVGSPSQPVEQIFLLSDTDIQDRGNRTNIRLAAPKTVQHQQRPSLRKSESK